MPNAHWYGLDGLAFKQPFPPARGRYIIYIYIHMYGWPYILYVCIRSHKSSAWALWSRRWHSCTAMVDEATQTTYETWEDCLQRQRAAAVEQMQAEETWEEYLQRQRLENWLWSRQQWLQQRLQQSSKQRPQEQQQQQQQGAAATEPEPEAATAAAQQQQPSSSSSDSWQDLQEDPLWQQQQQQRRQQSCCCT